MAMYYIVSSSTDPYYNLALEQYVFDSLSRDHTYFMLWQNDNAIIIGKHQNTLDEINASFVDQHQIKVARRLSGGGAVYHDMGNVNFTFIKDAEENATIDLSSFCVPVVKALATIGVNAAISGRNDMTIDGKKFSGNAQYIKEKRVMHHGTLMFNSNLNVLSQALNVSKDKLASKGVSSVKSRVTNIKATLQDDLSLDHFKKVILNHMIEENQMIPYKLTPEDETAIRKLMADRYSTWDWNYGQSPGYSLKKEKRIEGCGKVQLYLDIKKERIKGIQIRGDFFGANECSELENLLVNCPLTQEGLESALCDVPMDYYIKHLKTSDFITLILS